jgi:hypothetical protein
MSTRCVYLVASLALVFTATPAFADAIDGNWCHPDGRRLTIRGPAITTPGGNQLQGNYERHYFSYPIPASEPRAGDTVFMTLMGEYLVHLRIGKDSSNAGPVEEWKRCAPSISRRNGAGAAG